MEYVPADIGGLPEWVVLVVLIIVAIAAVLVIIGRR